MVVPDCVSFAYTICSDIALALRILHFLALRTAAYVLRKNRCIALRACVSMETGLTVRLVIWQSEIAKKFYQFIATLKINK